MARTRWTVTSVALVAQAISCSTVRGIFPVHELFWFCLVQVSTNQLRSFSSFPMARVSDGTDVPVSSVPDSSSNMGSPNGSLLDLEGVGGHTTSTMEENFEAMLTKRLAQFEAHSAALASIPTFVQGLKQYLVAYTISGVYHKQKFEH